MRTLVIVIAWALGWSGPAEAACEMLAEVDDSLRIEVPNGDDFAMSITDSMAVELLPGPARGRLRLRAVGDIEFVASVPFAHTVVVSDGRTVGPVTLHFGARARLQRITDEGVELRVPLGGGAWTTVGPIDCSDLVLQVSEHRDPPYAALPENRPIEVDVVGGRRVAVRDDQGETATIHGARPLWFKARDDRPGLLRVRRDYPTGVTVEGWVPTRGVREVDSRAVPGNGVEPGSDDEDEDTEREPRGGHSPLLCHRAPAHARRVVLNVGSPVLQDGPNGPAWATVRPGTVIEGLLTGDGLRVKLGVASCGSERAWMGLEHLADR